MKKALFAIAILWFLPGMLFSQTGMDYKKSDTINKMDAGNFRTGYWEEKGTDQMQKGSYVAGKKDGNWLTVLVVNNQILKLESFNHGLKEGITLTFDRKNKIMSQEYYKKDKLNGLCIVYGQYTEFPVSEINYTNGMKNGVSRLYYENSKIQEEAVYKNDKREGVTRWFNKTGKTVAEYYYKEGLFEGTQRDFYENDSIQTISNYSKNLLNGDYTERYRNGKLKITGKYVNGEKEGTWIEYDETGKAVTKTVWKAGKAGVPTQLK